MRSKRRCVLERKQPYSGDEWCSGAETEEEDEKPLSATHREFTRTHAHTHIHIHIHIHMRTHTHTHTHTHIHTHTQSAACQSEPVHEYCLINLNECFFL